MILMSGRLENTWCRGDADNWVFRLSMEIARYHENGSAWRFNIYLVWTRCIGWRLKRQFSRSGCDAGTQSTKRWDEFTDYTHKYEELPKNTRSTRLFWRISASPTGGGIRCHVVCPASTWLYTGRRIKWYSMGLSRWPNPIKNAPR